MIVLVTGVSGGLGSVLGRSLSARGVTVYGTMRDPKTSGLEFPFPVLPMEIGDEGSITACLDEILEREGRIDAVVNCVNRMVIGSVAETEIEEAISVYDTNVFGAMRLSRVAAEIMQKQGAGTIVSMSSLGGILAVPHMSTYTSSKFALEAFSEALYHELRPHGVDVVIMQPVAMRMDRPATGSHLELVAGVSPGSPSEAMLRKMEADTLASPLTPEQVAAKIHEVLLRPSKPLRVPMDRAKALTWVKALAPQRLIDKLIAGLLPELSRTRESSYVGGRSSD